MVSGRSEGSKRGQFQKGKSGNPGGKPKNGSTAVSPILRDLRWAYQHSADQRKGTPQQEDFRQLYRENHVKFLDLLTKHEGINKSAAKVEVPRDEAVREPEEFFDEDHERVEALCLELLDGVNEELRQKDVELAKRP